MNYVLVALLLIAIVVVLIFDGRRDQKQERENAILGMLLFRSPISARAIAEANSRVLTVALSGRTIRELERRGFVVSQRQTLGTKPERLWCLTEAGREEALRRAVAV